MMKRIGILLLLLLLMAGCDDGLYSGTLIFDGEHQFGPEASLPGDVLLRAGAAEFAAGSQVAGSIYVLGGALRLDGEVGGDLAVLGGRVDLGPTAVIHGDLRISQGTTTGVETAVVYGETLSGLPLPSENAPRSGGWQAVARWLAGALLLAALGGLWAQRQPQSLRHIADAATAHWPVSAALGLLAALTLPILLVMMLFTLVLIPLVLVLGLVSFLVLGLGIVALGAMVGEWLLARWPRPLNRWWTAFYGTLLLLGLYAVPVVGEVLLAGTAVLLFGAVLLTRLGYRAYQPPPLPGENDPLATYERP